MARRWTVQLLDALRAAAAADLGEPLRISDYRRWRREHADRAGDQVIVQRLGLSWKQALRASGIAHTRWAEEGLVEAVAAAVRRDDRAAARRLAHEQDVELEWRWLLGS